MTEIRPADETALLAERLTELNLPEFERENALAMIRRGEFIGGLASTAWQALERHAQGTATPEDKQLLMEAQLRALKLPEFEHANAQAMLKRGNFLGGLALDAWQAMGRKSTKPDSPDTPTG